MINCFIAGVLNAINKDGDYSKSTVIGGTLLAVLVGFPIGIGVYIYLKRKDKKEITL
jgi:ABC-type phosphate transport system permease subunit